MHYVELNPYQALTCLLFVWGDATLMQYEGNPTRVVQTKSVDKQRIITGQETTRIKPVPRLLSRNIKLINRRQSYDGVETYTTISLPDTW